MHQPQGRVANEPNSLGSTTPREAGPAGFACAAVEEAASKSRIRAESFADHYSQAWQFLRSQTGSEQAHIASALAFGLSKVDHLHLAPGDGLRMLA